MKRSQGPQKTREVWLGVSVPQNLAAVHLHGALGRWQLLACRRQVVRLSTFPRGASRAAQGIPTNRPLPSVSLT